jgi:AcrR family transcriptional regulator
VAGRGSADDVIAVALAGGQTVADAARNAGVAERTVYRRLEDTTFRRRVNELRADLVERALGRLTEGMTQAADRLMALVASKDEQVALRAARTVLELVPRLRESVEMERRLLDLEARLVGDGSEAPTEAGPGAASSNPQREESDHEANPASAPGASGEDGPCACPCACPDRPGRDVVE